MAKKPWTRNQRILLWTLIPTAILAVVAVAGLFMQEEKGSVAVEGDGAVVGNNATVLIDKRQGIDTEFLFSQTLQLAEAKGALEIGLKQAREERDKAIKRVEELEAQGNRPDAEKALRELRNTGDLTTLQRLLIEERDKHRDLLIQRNREIAGVAYLRGDIGITEEACKEILRLDPNDLHAMNCNGLVQQLHGDLDEAASLYTRLIEVATDQEDERWRAAATGNLGAVYRIRGDLDGTMVLLREVERICRQLGNMQGLVTALVNQASTLHQMGRACEALPLAEQAYDLATSHGYAALAKQIEPILNAVRRAVQGE